MPLAIDRHRRGNDELFELPGTLDHFLEQDSSPEIVGLYVPHDLVHRLADADLSCLMIYDIYAVKGLCDRCRITNVPANKLCRLIQVRRNAVAVHLFDQRIEDADTMALCYQTIDKMGADKARAAGHQYVHCFHSTSF